MERTGSRYYSAPRLASARGEEAARRAMPTRSGSGPGGGRAPGPVSLWSGTLGKREGGGSFRRRRRTVRFREAAGSVGALVIARLARHAGIISLFVRFVKSYLSLYILLSHRTPIFDRN